MGKFSLLGAGARSALKAITASIVVSALVACSTTSGSLPVKRSLSTTSYGYAKTSSPTRAGEVSQRFEVRPGDCASDTGWSDCANDRERSEVRGLTSIRPGEDVWLAFSIYLPNDFVTSDQVNTTLGQVHQTGGPSGSAGGLPSFPPLLQLNARGNSYRACLHVLTGPVDNVRDECRYFPLASIDSMRGRWTDILIHFDGAGGGAMEIYVNGRRQMSSSGFIRFQPQKSYPKYGIYRSFVSRHGGPLPTQVVFYDEVRMADSREAAEIDEANPVD